MTISTYRNPSDITQYFWALVFGLAIGAASFLSPFIGVAIIFLIVVLIAALNKPVTLLFLYTFTIVLFSGIPRGELIPLIVPNEPFLALTFGAGLLIILLTNAGRHDTEKISPYVILAIVVYFVGTALLPTLVYLMRGWRLSIPQMLNLLAPIQYLILFWVSANLPRNEEERLQLLHVMIFCASIVSITGLLQAVGFGPMMAILERFYPSEHLATAVESGRVTSILNAWNSLGNFLMIALVLILNVAGLNRAGTLGKINIVTALLLCVACLIASGSFASFGGVILALAITKFFDRRGLKLLGWMAILGVLAVIVLWPIISIRFDYQFGGAGNSGTPQTLEYRFHLWETIFFPALGKNNNWAWGISPLLNTGIFTWAWTENHYLFLLVRSGIISLVAHLLWVGMMMRWMWNIRKRSESDVQRMIANVAFALMATLTLMGMTNEVFTNSGSIDYFWMLMGIAAKGGDMMTSRRRAVEPDEPAKEIIAVDVPRLAPTTGRG
jgi:hypothetical protein